MQVSGVLQRGMVLASVVAPRSGERLCVLLDDATQPRVRLRVAHRDGRGGVLLTDQEFVVPLSALDALRPVDGLTVDAWDDLPPSSLPS